MLICSVVSHSLWPHGLQHIRLASFTISLSFLKLTSTESDAIQPSHPLSPHPPRALCLSHHRGLFASGGQTIGASASDLPMNIQGWFPNLGLINLISLLSKGLSRIFSSTTVWKHQFFGAQPSLWSGSHIVTWLLEGNTITLTLQTFVGKVMSLVLNTLCKFVIAFPPRSKRLLISWLQSLQWFWSLLEAQNLRVNSGKKGTYFCKGLTQ